MSGHTALWCCLYSSSLLSFTLRIKPTLFMMLTVNRFWIRSRWQIQNPKSVDPWSLEVELVDVVFVEHGGLAEKHGTILGDGVVTELACRERVAGVALDLAAGYRVKRVDGEVAEVRGVPQLKGGGR